MTQDETIAAVRAMHKPEAQERMMVYEVWCDGEVTLTKGGDLYGLRRLHATMWGEEGHGLPVGSLFPRYAHSRIMVETYEQAVEARTLILGDMA